MTVASGAQTPVHESKMSGCADMSVGGKNSTYEEADGHSTTHKQHLMHLVRPKIWWHILLQPASPSDASASISGRGASVKTAAAATSASTSGRRASVQNAIPTHRVSTIWLRVSAGSARRCASVPTDSRASSARIAGTVGYVVIRVPITLPRKGS